MILVCGDAMIDEYWFGDVSRISPEAPVPIVKMGKVETRLGAAANVALNVEAMGETCFRVFSPSIWVRKIRLMARSQQVARIDYDYPQTMVDENAFEDALLHAKVIVFSDYNKGAIPHVQRLIQKAVRTGKPVLVDPKGHNFAKYMDATLIKPNTDELKEVVGGWESEEELLDKAQRVRRETNIKAILLTRAAQGMSLFDDGGVTHIPSVAQEVFDVTGAGDSAIAALSVGLYKGMGIAEASRLANRAAGLAVAHLGTAVISKEELFA